MPRRFHFLAIGPMILALGCSGSASSSAVPNSIQGQVYFRGQPLNGGTIVFSPDPDRGNTGPLSCGNIDGRGRYAIVARGDEPITLGWHRVAIAPLPRNGLAETRQSVSLFQNVPERYRNPMLSGLVCELKNSGNGFDVYLEDY